MWYAENVSAHVLSAVQLSLHNHAQQMQMCLTQSPLGSSTMTYVILLVQVVEFSDGHQASDDGLCTFSDAVRQEPVQL